MKLEERQVQQVVAKCELMLEEWRRGRNASPDQRDFVIAACEVLDLNWVAHEEVVNRIAGELDEDAGETYTTLREVAVYALSGLRGLAVA